MSFLDQIFVAPHWSFLRTGTHVSYFGVLPISAKWLLNPWQMEDKELGFNALAWSFFDDCTLVL